MVWRLYFYWDACSLTCFHSFEKRLRFHLPRRLWVSVHKLDRSSRPVKVTNILNSPRLYYLLASSIHDIFFEFIAQNFNQELWFWQNRQNFVMFLLKYNRSLSQVEVMCGIMSRVFQCTVLAKLKFACSTLEQISSNWSYATRTAFWIWVLDSWYLLDLDFWDFGIFFHVW